MSRRALIACVLLVPLRAPADFFPIPVKHREQPRQGEILYEVGAFAGEPAGVNPSLALWGTRRMPFLMRIDGMYYGSAIKGIEMELGWAFDQDGPVRQYIAMAYGTGRLTWGGSYSDWEAAGPVYGLRLWGFAATVGYLVGHGEHASGPLAPVESIRTKLFVQAGYTFHW